MSGFFDRISLIKKDSSTRSVLCALFIIRPSIMDDDNLFPAKSYTNYLYVTAKVPPSLYFSILFVKFSLSICVTGSVIAVTSGSSKFSRNTK